MATIIIDSAINVQEKVLKLKALLDISKALGSEIELENLLQIIVDKTTEIMNADRSTLFIYDENRDELWSKIAQDLEIKEIRFPLGVGLAGYVAQSRRRLNIPNAQVEPKFNREFDQKTGYHTQTVLCQPIISSERKLIGVIQVLNKKNNGVFSKEDEIFLEAFSTQASVAIERASLTKAYIEKQRIHEALRFAHDIQFSMLPKKFPTFSDRRHIDVFAFLDPAIEVGGDFYDFFFVDDDHFCFMVGDVSDKGVPAAIFMAMTKTLLKATVKSGWRPHEVLQIANEELSIDNDAAMFVTIFIGIINIQTGTVVYSNGGHNQPYLISREGVAMLKTPSGMALGIADDVNFSTRQITLQQGEGFFIYTDGANEAMDKDGNLFSQHRLTALLEKSRGLSSKEIIENVVAAVKVFSMGTTKSDDITVLSIKYNP
jgi:serine phosphatase RsbU (regulator of sigma subunit)